MRHKWMILLMVVLTTGGVAAGTFLLSKKVYNATVFVAPTDAFQQRQQGASAVAGQPAQNRSDLLVTMATSPELLQRALRTITPRIGPDALFDARIEMLARLGRSIDDLDFLRRLPRAMRNSPIEFNPAHPRPDSVQMKDTSDMVQLQRFHGQADLTASEFQNILHLFYTADIFLGHSGVPRRGLNQFRIRQDIHKYLDTKFRKDFPGIENYAINKEKQYAEWLAKTLEVGAMRRSRERPGESDIIGITITWGHPFYAGYIANSVAAAFRSYYERKSKDAAERDIQRLENELEKARQKRDAKRLVVLKTTGYKQEPILQGQMGAGIQILGQARFQRDQTGAELASAVSRLSVLQGQLAVTPPDREEKIVSESTALDSLRKARDELRTRLLMEGARYTPSHPALVRLQKEIDSIDKEIALETGKKITRINIVPNMAYSALKDEIAQLEATRASLESKVAELDKVLAAQQSKFDALAKKDTAISPFLAELKQEEENYSRLYAALSNARLSRDMTQDTSGSLTVVGSRSEGPLREGKDPKKLTLAAFVLSLGISVGLAVARDYMDTSIRTRQDAVDMIGLPVHGIVPALPGGVGQLKLPRITQISPASPHAEAYRFLTTDLLLSSQEKDIKTIMGATPKPGQGGTTTMSNLAITMAQAGKRVVLVDCDMRRPLLHKIFGVSNEIGLSNVLSNGIGVWEALKPTEVENLILLPAGDVPENAWSLLRSQKMRDIVQTLRDRSDFVFFDTPSAVVFADATVIASMVDGVLIILRANQSPRGNEFQLKEMLNKVNSNILGVVLNDADPRTVDSFFYHYQYYPTRKDAEAKKSDKPEELLPPPEKKDPGDIDPFGSA
ncbi:MAG: polysaccharide biosynthesis tyrosine autokinase [Armatimonadetes bacterium]|nr:polysaccharide biosynthesis tyrosine autokinase [Armatimonadota bacterium]